MSSERPAAEVVAERAFVQAKGDLRVAYAIAAQDLAEACQFDGRSIVDTVNSAMRIGAALDKLWGVHEARERTMRACKEFRERYPEFFARKEES